MAESSSRRSTRQALLRSQESASPWPPYSSSSSSLYRPVLITTPAASRGSSASIQSIYAAKMKSSTTMFDHHRHRQKRFCMCAPTTHPGSFKCSLHKSTLGPGQQQQQRFAVGQDSSNHLNNARRYAMRNSLVRIGVNVQGDFVRRALAIRHTSNQQRRCVGFQKKPSRLSNNVSVSGDE